MYFKAVPCEAMKLQNFTAINAACTAVFITVLLIYVAMFPFLPSFVAKSSSSGATPEREGVHASTHDEPDSGSIVTDLDNNTDEAGILKVYSCGLKDTTIGSEASLVLLPHSTTFFVSGFCHITLLRGQASIYGYTLSLYETQWNIYAPPWSPALPLEATVKNSQCSKNGGKGGKQTISKALKRANKSDILEVISRESFEELDKCQGSVVLVEAIGKREQEWMVRSRGC